MARRDRRNRDPEFVLVWVDQYSNTNTQHTKDVLNKLRMYVDEVSLFQNEADCIQRLLASKTSKYIIVCSGSIGKKLVPEIHAMDNLICVFIFCQNKSANQIWAQSWVKIKGVHTSMNTICIKLEKVIREINRDEESLSIIPVCGNSVQPSKRLPPSFMYSELLKETLMQLVYENNYIAKIVENLLEKYQNNLNELQCIQNFSENYRPEKAIWWYTRECFVYKEVNQALRFLDAATMIDMGFFICDLHNALTKLHRDQFQNFSNDSFTIYRGQGLSKSDFNQLNDNRRSLLGFNSFLSTSKNKDVSLEYAERAALRPGFVGILFKITVNPKQAWVPFADIQDKSYYKNESEVLFGMHTIFSIGKIRQLAKNIYQISLHLTSESDQQMKILKHYMRQKYAEYRELARLTQILVDMEDYSKAEEICHELLKKTSSKKEHATHCLQMGFIKMKQGAFQECITYYETAIRHRIEVFGENNPAVGESYSDLACVYINIGENNKALTHLGKALEIYQSALTDDHPNLATCYNSIGEVYYRTGNFPKALHYLEMSLAIRKERLPNNHQDLAKTYNNIGEVFRSLGKYSEALENHRRSLKIYEAVLPDDHSDIATSHDNIGSVYISMKDTNNALSHYLKSLSLRKQSLGEDSHELAKNYNSIGNVYYIVKDYPTALINYQKAHLINGKYLLETHPYMATDYYNMGSVYREMKDFGKAIELFEKSLSIREKMLEPGHPDLIAVQNSIRMLKKSCL